MSLGLYTNYALNNYNQTGINKKTSEEKINSTDDSKSVTESNSVSKTESNSVDEYYKKLCAKFPNLNIQVGHYSEGSMFPTSTNINHAPITIDPAYLKKAASDPKVAVKLEKNLGDEPMALDWLKNMVKMNGSKITSLGTYINSDGGMSGASGLATDNSSSKNKSITNILDIDMDKIMKRRLENIKEERKAEAKKLDEMYKENSKAAGVYKRAAKSYKNNIFNNLNINLLNLNK